LLAFAASDSCVQRVQMPFQPLQALLRFLHLLFECLHPIGQRHGR
jgi:hypothetical protein